MRLCEQSGWAVYWNYVSAAVYFCCILILSQAHKYILYINIFANELVYSLNKNIECIHFNAMFCNIAGLLFSFGNFFSSSLT